MLTLQGCSCVIRIGLDARLIGYLDKPTTQPDCGVAFSLIPRLFTYMAWRFAAGRRVFERLAKS